MKIQRSEIYLFILVGLLVVSTNLGLVNRFVSIQSGSGENLIGLRDILVAMTVIYGLRVVRRPFALTNGIHLVIAGVLLMTPFSAIIGIMNGADLITVLRESAVMASWAIPFFAARYLQHTGKYVVMGQVIIYVGLLTSIGVIIEGISGGRIALVTPAVSVLEMTKRSTPSGWPTMVMAANVLIVLLFRDHTVSSFALKLRRFIFFSIIVIASLLTQSRTLIISIIGPTAVFLTFSFFISPLRLRWNNIIVVIIFLSLVVFPIVLYFGNNWLKDDFSDYYKKRYSVLTSLDSANEDIEDGNARVEELKVIFSDRVPESPLFGHGLSTIYRSYDSATLVHSIFGFFALRYGLIGLLLWSVFIVIVLRTMARALLDHSITGIWGQAFSTAVFGIIVGATFGNVFATTYGVNQAMIGLSCLMAYIDSVSLKIKQQ